MPAAGKENARKRNAPAAAGARDVITVEVVDGPAKGQVFTKQVRRAPDAPPRTTRERFARARSPSREARAFVPPRFVRRGPPDTIAADAARFPSRPGNAAHRPLPSRSSLPSRS